MITPRQALKVEDVGIYLGDRFILQNFSAEITPGEFIAVVGPNGAGKSTALRTLAGLIAPARGKVLLDGRPLSDLERRDLGRKIAYLPQDRTVHWPVIAERVVAFGRLPHRMFAAGESSADRRAVQVAMQRMDVMHLAQRPIITLSGGERARVLVARALAQQTEYIIADEPTAGLDPAHSLKLFQEFERLARDGHTIVAAMHDLSLALRYAKRVILMVGGRVMADGTAADVLNKKQIAEAFSIETIVTMIDGIPVVLPFSALT